MAIDYLHLDITTITHGVIAHGCNCQGKMGAGVALAVRHKWPIAYHDYVEAIRIVGNDKERLLGKCQIVPVVETDWSRLYVANCFTQLYYGRQPKQYASVDAIRHSLTSAVNWATRFDIPMYMTRIGCSLGGLVWDTQVLPVVERIAQTHSTTIYVCDKP